MTVTWYQSVARELAGKPCTYFYAGAMFRTENFKADLVSALSEEGLNPSVIDWGDLAADGMSDSVLEQAAAGDIVVLWRPESLEHRKDFREVLGRTRPKVQAVLANHAHVLIVSHFPRGRFDHPDGSSIFADASRVVPDVDVAACARDVNSSIDCGTADRIADFAGRSIALAEAYSRIETSGISGNRKHAEAGRVTQETLERALGELGPALLATLEYFVCECRYYELLQGDLGLAETSVLESAGLARVDDQGGTVDLFPEAIRGAATVGLERVVRGLVAPPEDWSRLAGMLFELERRLRAAFSAHLAEAFGENWRQVGLQGVGNRALALAQSSGHPRAGVVDDLHAPLDWLLLDDLLELGKGLASLSPVAGLVQKDLVRLQTTIVPIRNRVSHMRLPRDGDESLVRRELTLVRLRTGANGSSAVPAVAVGGNS